MENKTICTACGGRCCQRYAGGYHPNDLKPVTTESLVHRFASRIYAIDWWEGDVRPDKNEWSISLFIRPAHVGITQLHDPSWGGVCVHWNATDGCCFELRHRPKGCRELIPRKDNKCDELSFGKRETAVVWAPYKQNIEEAAIIVEEIFKQE